MRKPVLLAALVGALFLGGCYRHDYYYTTAQSEPVEALWQWNHHLFWGIVRLNRGVPLDAVCPQGIARIENWMGPLQVVLSVLTAGVYTPTTVRVFCGKHLAAVDVDVELDEQGVRELQRAHPDLEERVRAALAPDAPPPVPPALDATGGEG